MQIRSSQPGDGAALLDLMMALDTETQFMMLEPGERKTTVAEQEKIIASFQSTRERVMFVVEDSEQLVGFVVGVGQQPQRKTHCMSCVIGLRQSAVGQGLGQRLMTALEAWAWDHEFTRLELTVMAHNERAKRLYLRQGFDIEGVKRNSLRIDDSNVDELYMAKLKTDSVSKD